MTHALVFDCDGTLVDSAPLYQRAWTRAMADAGHALDADWFTACFGLSEGLLMARYEADFGARIDREAVVAGVRTAFIDLLPALLPVPPVAALVRAARGRVPLAVASSGPP